MTANSLHPLVEEVLLRQLRLLRVVHLVLLSLVVVVLAVSIVLGGPEEDLVAAGLGWLRLGLAGLSLVLLLVVIPLVRRRLMTLAKIQKANNQTLAGWGLPADVDPIIGRQADFLTRYSAGCVISWGTAAAVGLYGLVVYVLGGSLIFSLLFFACAIAALAAWAPRRLVLMRRLLELGESGYSVSSS